MTNDSLGPLPKTITGGCLCSAVRYRITFPEGHDFEASNAICQCTQCRKQTGSLFMASFQAPLTSLTWLPSASSAAPSDGTERAATDFPPAIKTYSASAGAHRGFCRECGSVLFWRSLSYQRITFLIGSVDALYLFGDGADGTDVPKEGFGRALCSGKGSTEWCANEIKGVTDEIPLLFKGKRSEHDSMA